MELIKRQGTYLGVVVGSGRTNDDSTAPPRITQLIPGSWAQRSDVLCTGDVIVGVNGLEADSLSREKLRQILDESDRYLNISCAEYLLYKNELYEYILC